MAEMAYLDKVAVMRMKDDTSPKRTEIGNELNIQRSRL